VVAAHGEVMSFAGMDVDELFLVPEATIVSARPRARRLPDPGPARTAVLGALLEEIMAGLARVHQYTIMCAPTTAQDAALEALLYGEQFVQQMAAEYDRRRRLIVGGFNGIGLPTCEPHGAFYSFPDITSTGLDDETFSQRLLLEEKVAAIPGRYFGPGGEGFVRCSYATAYEKIEEALMRIERFVKRI